MLESAVPCGQAFKYKAEGSVPTLIATIVLEGGEEMLRIALDNVTPEGRPVLTPTECAAVFQQGAKGPSASARSHDQPPLKVRGVCELVICGRRSQLPKFTVAASCAARAAT